MTTWQNGLQFDSTGALITSASTGGNTNIGINPTRLISIGDSLSIASTNYGTSTAANMFMAKLATAYSFGGAGGAPNGTNFVESAIVGITHLRYINALNNALAISNTDLVCGLLYFNSLRLLGGPDPSNYMIDWQQQCEAILSFLCIPESLKVRAINRGTTTPNPAIVTTGTWAYFTASGGTDLNQLALRSSTSNATATFPAVTGDTVYIWYMRSILNEIFQISVDGAVYEVSGPCSFDLSVSNNWQLEVLRVNGLTNGAHTVVATHSPNAATIVAIAGFTASSVRSQCAAMVIGGCLPMMFNVAGRGYDFAGAANNSPVTSIAAVAAAITLGSSPAVYTAPADGYVVISGGTVSAIAVSRDSGTTFFVTGATAGVFPVGRGDQIKVTYSVIPTVAEHFPIAPGKTEGHTGVRLTNDYIKNAIINLQEDGLRVQYVDATSKILVSSTSSVNAPHVAGDFVHLTDYGNQVLYQYFRKQLNPVFGM